MIFLPIASKLWLLDFYNEALDNMYYFKQLNIKHNSMFVILDTQVLPQVGLIEYDHCGRIYVLAL